MATQNESIRELQSALIREHKKLHDSLDDVTDAKTAQQIVREMQEVNHRIALAGSLLFAKQSKALDSKVANVRKATGKVNKAIANLKNLKAFLDAISGFLGLVDEALDFAKGF